MENSKKKWSKWVVTSDWEVWNPEMVPRDAESNRRTWVPQQESEWKSKWHRDIRRQRSHTFGGTSYCPQNKDSDELGGIDSTDHEGNQE